GVMTTRPDTIVAEEPLEIRVDRRPLAVTMRTPGHDLDLALGFLLTEGVIRSTDDVRTAQLCAGSDEPNTYNVVEGALRPGVPAPVTDPSRNFYTTSSCGVRGKASIDPVRTRSVFPVAGAPATRARAPLVGLPAELRTVAVELAEEVGITLFGFLRGSTMNVYTRPDRITSGPPLPSLPG